ncbi:MAG: tetratricopeptide (TPR) repeat protein, partial [Bacteroidia bacterium]
YQDYKASSTTFGNIIVVGKDGKVDIPSSKQFELILYGILNSSFKKLSLLDALNEATLYCNDLKLESAMRIMRTEFVDKKYPVDTNITEDAKEVYKEAEQSFWAKNYNEAAGLYAESVDLDSTYYKARLYLGDSYYHLEEYSRAAPIFNECAERFPNLLEPQKYYADALEGMEQWEKALDAAIEGLLRFPEVGMFSRCSDYAEKMGKEFEQEWIPKQCPVNVATDTVEIETMNLEQYPEYWEYYVEAKGKIARYTDKDGMLSTNSLTDYMTLEAYCWDHMLERADKDIEELAFARKMKAAGYLEPYVLISLFHYDLFDQYKAYIAGHKTEAEAFLHALVQ